MRGAPEAIFRGRALGPSSRGALPPSAGGGGSLLPIGHGACRSFSFPAPHLLADEAGCTVRMRRTPGEPKKPRPEAGGAQRAERGGEGRGFGAGAAGTAPRWRRGGERGPLRRRRRPPESARPGLRRG